MCICGSKVDFNSCCGEILSHKRKAASAQELMRSRYTAYVKADARYILLSSVSENQHAQDVELIENFATSVEWLKLEILESQEEKVEFKAYYRDSEGIKVLHELSSFIQEDGVWKYKDGELYNSKVQRNEPCPCGSNKKHKKCCG